MTQPTNEPARLDDRVSDILTLPARSVLPQHAIERAERLLEGIRAHHLLVAQGDTLHGVLCSCDLRRGSPTTPVRDVMTTKPVVIDARARLTLAVAAMDRHGVNCLPSHWEGNWGLLTRGDLVRHGIAKRRVCVSCGSHHHVRRYRATGGAWCRDCYDPFFSVDDVASLYRDLGEAG